MTMQSFNTGWAFRPKANLFSESSSSSEWQEVTLPHDAVIGLDRDPSLDSGAATAYFPYGVYEYRRIFPLAQDDVGKHVTLIFDGVYRDAMIYVNGARARHEPYGYTRFLVRIDPFLKVGDNEVRIECRNGADSRWYTGSGIYRDVHLLIQDRVHIVPQSLQVTALDCDAEFAIIEVRADVRNDGPVTRTLRFVSEALSGDGKACEGDDTPVTVRPGETGCVRQRLYIAAPALWNVDTPNLYRMQVSLTHGEGKALDRTETTFGIRTLRIDPHRGLRINGQPIKLRGGCIHHDNGVIGTATIARAEERRIELLKQAGFNAIRSAHNPISAAMLEACDRLGMLLTAR